MSRDQQVTRRTVLRTAGGAAAAGAALAGTSPAAAQGVDYGGWFSGSGKGGETASYDGTTADRTGEEQVTVEVGAEGNGGPYAFAPTAVQISPGTTVVFEWTSDTHNVLVEDAPDGAEWSGHEPIEDTGFSFEHTFETEGIYTYYCEPHLTLGMKGAIVVGDAPSGGDGGNRRPDWDGWLSDVDGGYRDARGEGDVTLEVGAQGNGGPYAFSPAGLWIDPGTTVTFEWTSDTHNVAVESRPEGAGWEGHEAIEDSGFSYEHTFETGGIYTYYCDPHRSLGMLGAIAVGDDVPTVAEDAQGDGGTPGTPQAGGPADGDAAGGGPVVPLHGDPIGSAIVLAMLGAASVAVLPILLSEAYGSLQRPGETDEPGREKAETVREIGHDEFDPTGTLALIAIYFVILLVMWVFVYFVEFLGNGPTVIG